MTTAITFPSVTHIEAIAKLTVSVTSPESKADAETHLGRIRLATKNLKADVAAAKKPYKDAIDLIDQAAKPWASRLSEQDQAFERAILAYNTKVRLAVAAANAKTLERYEAKVERKESDAIAHNKPLPLILPPALKAEPAKTDTVEGAKITTMTRKAWRIPGTSEKPENLSRASAFVKDVPDEYFLLDTARIGKVVRAGGTIPGIEVFTEESLSVRS